MWQRGSTDERAEFKWQGYKGSKRPVLWLGQSVITPVPEGQSSHTPRSFAALQAMGVFEVTSIGNKNAPVNCRINSTDVDGLLSVFYR